MRLARRFRNSLATEKGAEYRRHLVLSEQRAQEDFDKAVMISLSGGGLGNSFAFVDKFIKTSQPAHHWLLFGAWIAWAISILAVLLSYFASIRACRRVIRQVDAKTIHREEPGFAYLVDAYNYAGIGFFLIGVE